VTATEVYWIALYEILVGYSPPPWSQPLGRPQGDQGGAPATGAFVRQSEGIDLGQAADNGVHLAAQGTDAFAMDDAHLENPALAARSQVLGHEFLRFPGQERVQVQDSVDGNFCCP